MIDFETRLITIVGCLAAAAIVATYGVACVASGLLPSASNASGGRTDLPPIVAAMRVPSAGPPFTFVRILSR